MPLKQIHRLRARGCRNAQSTFDEPEPVSLWVHSVVERHDEPDIVPKPTKRLWQCAGNITQPAGVGKRHGLRSSKKDFHPGDPALCTACDDEQWRGRRDS